MTEEARSGSELAGGGRVRGWRVLAAIAVKGLIDVGELCRVWRVGRFDFSVSRVAFAAVPVLGIVKGVMVAVVVFRVEASLLYFNVQHVLSG